MLLQSMPTFYVELYL